MSKVIEAVNVLASRCGYFYNAFLDEGVLLNSGYNRKHPKQNEVEEMGQRKFGCCYSWSCPLGCEADEEDFDNNAIDNQGYEYEENQFIVVERRNKDV